MVHSRRINRTIFLGSLKWKKKLSRTEETDVHICLADHVDVHLIQYRCVRNSNLRIFLQFMYTSGPHPRHSWRFLCTDGTSEVSRASWEIRMMNFRLKYATMCTSERLRYFQLAHNRIVRMGIRFVSNFASEYCGSKVEIWKLLLCVVSDNFPGF